MLKPDPWIFPLGSGVLSRTLGIWRALWKKGPETRKKWKPLPKKGLQAWSQEETGTQRVPERVLFRRPELKGGFSVCPSKHPRKGSVTGKSGRNLGRTSNPLATGLRRVSQRSDRRGLVVQWTPKACQPLGVILRKPSCTLNDFHKVVR